jgi:hypothetical protein
VESEDPAGYFRLGIWTPKGLPAIGGTVRVQIRYDITDKEEPAKP